MPNHILKKKKKKLEFVFLGSLVKYEHLHELSH